MARYVTLIRFTEKELAKSRSPRSALAFDAAVRKPASTLRLNIGRLALTTDCSSSARRVRRKRSTASRNWPQVALSERKRFQPSM